jgi:hypothetical protein
MKHSFTSRVCQFLGTTIIGKASDLFGVDVPELWTMSYDLDPIKPGQSKDPAWLELRIAYAYLRRHLMYRVGFVASGILASLVVILTILNFFFPHLLMIHV